VARFAMPMGLAELPVFMNPIRKVPSHPAEGREPGSFHVSFVL
jgi:hypothetical protein